MCRAQLLCKGCLLCLNPLLVTVEVAEIKTAGLALGNMVVVALGDRGVGGLISTWPLYAILA